MAKKVYVVGYALLVLVDMANLADNAELIEYNRGLRLDSFIGSIDTLMSKLALALVSMIMANALEKTEFVAQAVVQNEATQNVIMAFMGWVPLVCGILMLIVCWKYPIEKELPKMHEGKSMNARELK